MSEYKNDSPTWCGRHQCAKTWMIQNAFCPKCEAETHGDKGLVQKTPDDELTIPDFDFQQVDWTKTKFESYYLGGNTVQDFIVVPVLTADKYYFYFYNDMGVMIPPSLQMQISGKDLKNLGISFLLDTPLPWTDDLLKVFPKH